jgi:hypothetical protein
MVPKITMTFLVIKTRDSLYGTLTEELYKEDLYAELLSENRGVAAKRDRCRKDI